MTIPELNSKTGAFFDTYLGKALDTDGAPPKNPYQCVDPIKRFLSDYWGIGPHAIGRALNYYLKTPASILEHFNKVPTTDVKKGDIVVLRTVGHVDLNGDGHVMIGTGNQNGSQFEGFEQNGSTGNGLGKGNDRMRYRWVAKSRIVGVLRAKTTAPPPAPVPVKMPPLHSSIQILKGYTRTTFRPGTDTEAGKIKAVNDSFYYHVRGYDTKFPYRIIINSATGGGNGVALALYYKDGKRIEGWK